MSATSATRSTAADANTKTLNLVTHPVCGDLGAVGVVTVQVISTIKELRLIYDIRSRLAIKVPTLRGERPGRHDELWFQTCCELFIRDPQQPGPYLEFNFSPAGDFASYAFDDPLQGMRSHRWPGPLQELSVRSNILRSKIPDLLGDSFLHRLVVEVSIPKIAIGGSTQLYPTVVLETVAGISLWAIWHPIDRPHFHHPKNFLRALDIP
ncbi:MAG: hypothetical protein FJ196_00860 [Gammaproteobacteria bacterium]|nr:hypothetical protein [Gammaproteobacteria bacterium]